MMYTVLKPFNASGERFRRGESVPEEQVVSWKNKAVLLRTDHIVPKMDFNTFRIHRSFVANGKRWMVGELVQNPHWRNLESLLGSGYIQPTSPSEGVASTAPSEIWKDRSWLAQRYVTEERSPVAIAKEAGCSVGTLYHWLHKYGLKQPGWRQHRRIPKD